MPNQKSMLHPLAIDEMSVDKMPVGEMTGYQNRMFPRQHEKVFFSLSKYLNTHKKNFLSKQLLPPPTQPFHTKEISVQLTSY
jgi:hypothetical protein